MADTYYLRSSAGEACGPGTRRDLLTAAGASATTASLDGNFPGDTWNIPLSPGMSVKAGTWRLLLDIATGAGGGTQRIAYSVERRDAACVLQETIMSGNIDLTAGTTQEYTASASVGRIDFAGGDILLVTLTDGVGTNTKTLHFNGAAGGASDSRLELPGERRIFNVT